MFISEKSSGSGAPTPYLTVYDVGNTNAKQTRGNTQLRVYRNVSIGKLRFYKLLKIDDHLYDILYNLFPYQESIILSGRVSGPTSTVITLASCVFNFDKAVLSCDPKLKGTAVTEGMIGLNSSGHYFEINTQTNKITVAALHGRFADNNWNRDVLYTQSNLDLIHNESAFIRYYTGTGAMGVINYGTLAGGPDYGYTGISYASGISWGVVGSVAAQIGNSVVFGVSDQSGEHEGDVVSIMRPNNPYLLVDSSKLPSGQTSVVGLEIEDQDSTTPYSVSGSFTVVATIFDKINVLSSAYGDISIKGGYSTELELKDEDIVQGNSIEVTATSADNSVHGKSYSGAKLNITWNPSHDHNDILSYQFFGQKAVVQNTRGSMWFYNCRRNSGSHDRVCDQYASYPGPVSLPILKITYLSNVLFTWTCSNGNCFAIFVQNNGDVSLVNIGGGVKDMFFGLDNQIPNWIRLVVTTNDSVEIFRSSKYEPSGMSLWYTISQENSREEWFCPTNIYHCPDNEDILEILNDCQGYNQKVLKYRIGDMKVDFLNKTNLDSLTMNPFFCPMGSEFIVGSTSSKNKYPLYSFGTTDDLNFWTVPPTLLGDNFWTFNCLSHMKRFVTYGFNKDKTVDATVIVGNRGSDQLRRYSNVIKGVHANNAMASEGMEGSVLHWFSTDNGPLFFETYDKPILEITANKVTQATPVQVTFSFTNQGSGKKTFTKTVNVTP
jgi:hypothetical protein